MNVTRRQAIGLAGGAVVIVAVAVTLAITLGGSGSGHPAPPPAAHPHRSGALSNRIDGGALTALSAMDFLTLDPGRAYDSLDYEVIGATQRPLYSFLPAATQRLTPDLAAGPPALSDGDRVVTVHIRQGVHFSPPVDREVTSADVAYAIQRGANPNVANPYFRAYFGDLVGAGTADGGPIPGITTPDRYTIVFHLDQPIGQFFAQALSLPLSAPVPAGYAQPFDANHPSDYADYQVATGPYMLANDHAGRVLGIGWVPHRAATLVRNPNWRRSTDFRPAYLDSIDIALNVGQATAAEAVLGGRDAVELGAPEPEAVTAATAAFPSQIFSVPDAGAEYAGLSETGPFSNVDVRRAVWAQVNRDALARTLKGFAPAKPGTHFIYPGVPGFTAAGGYAGPHMDFNLHLAGDPTLAASYMRKAGYRSGRYSGPAIVNVIGGPINPARSQAKIFDTALRALGFKTSLTLRGNVLGYGQCAALPRPTVCPDLGFTRDFDDAQTVIAPTFGDVPIASLRRAISAAQLVTSGARARAWASVDRALVSNAVAIPFAFNSLRVIESSNVSGVLDLWEPGNWDFAFTALNRTPPGPLLIV